MTKAVRLAAGKINAKRSGTESNAIQESKASNAKPRAEAFRSLPRSSNLGLARKFTQQDLDRFQVDTFEFIASYFENSLSELESRNAGIQTTFRRIDADRFSSIVYRDGEPVARTTIFSGNDNYANGIAYSSGDSGRTNSFNELLTAMADDQMMYFQPMGMSQLLSRDSREKKLTMEGAAEAYWSMLIAPLQSQR